jgi:uncharacterized protein (DUF736 family)
MKGLKRVGGLWVKKSKSGNKYISISLRLEGNKVINLLAFENTRKRKNKNYPDYEIFQKIETEKSETKEQDNKDNNV